MPIRVGKRYLGRVVEGRLFESSARKTPGFQILIDTEDGSIEYPIWLTKKNRDKAIRDFETLGVDPAQLSSRNFLTYELPRVVQGCEVVIEPKEEEYNGKTSVKVPWIGKPGAASEEEIAASVAVFFGGDGQVVGVGRDPIDSIDDEPPF